MIQSADVSTGEVPKPAAVPEESAGGGALGVFQAASVGERMAVEPLAEAPAARSASQPWWLRGSPRDARRLARRRPWWLRGSPRDARRLARRRPTSASRPAVRRWTSLRMPDRPTATGQPAVDTLGTPVVKINRDEM